MNGPCTALAAVHSDGPAAAFDRPFPVLVDRRRPPSLNLREVWSELVEVNLRLVLGTRAFDRGLIAINPDNYRVIVSNRMTEPRTSTYSIRQFEGQEIRLPKSEKYRPSKDNLAEHLERFAGNF